MSDNLTDLIMSLTPEDGRGCVKILSSMVDPESRRSPEWAAAVFCSGVGRRIRGTEETVPAGFSKLEFSHSLGPERSSNGDYLRCGAALKPNNG